MACCSCKNLDEKNPAKGVMGCRYYCKKLKTYVGGDNPECAKFEKSLTRSNSKCDDIYEEGKDFYNDTHSVGYYVVILIFMIVILIIALITGRDLYF